MIVSAFGCFTFAPPPLFDAEAARKVTRCKLGMEAEEVRCVAEAAWHGKNPKGETITVFYFLVRYLVIFCLSPFLLRH